MKSPISVPLRTPRRPTMEDKLREKIAEILLTNPWEVDLVDNILSLLAPELADAEKWRKVMEVYHAETEERFVQFANTISKVRELEGEGEKG
jgi:hypothetical protein